MNLRYLAFAAPYQHLFPLKPVSGSPHHHKIVSPPPSVEVILNLPTYVRYNFTLGPLPDDCVLYLFPVYLDATIATGAVTMSFFLLACTVRTPQSATVTSTASWNPPVSFGNPDPMNT